MTGPAKAKLVVHWVAAPEEEIGILYNPTELAFEKSVQLAEITIPGLNTPLQQFVRGQAEKLTLVYCSPFSKPTVREWRG